MKTIKIRIPATTANLGSGFDVFGAALNLYNEIEIVADGSVPKGLQHRVKGVRIEVEGEGKDTLPRDEKNIVWKAMQLVLDKLGRRQKVEGRRFDIKLINRIPMASGLGSSASAILGGLLIANKICYNKLSDDEIIKLAVSIEGHPDNIVPAFAGGFCICYSGGSITQDGFRKCSMPSDLVAVICVPKFEVETKFARRILPKNVPLESAVFNISRASLFVAAILGKDYRLLGVAMEDELHQKYRGKYIPGIDGVFAAAEKAGAYGTCISGSGPTILSVSGQQSAVRIGKAMQKAFAKYEIKSRYNVCNFDNAGAKIYLKN